jgi:hypothetical protein
MNNKRLIEKLAASVEGVPAQAEVIGLRQYSLDEIEQRAKRFLSTIAAALNLSLSRSDWVMKRDQTLIRLPLEARAVIYHASGAMKLIAGLKPMESLFKKGEDPKELMKQVERTANQLNIGQWAGPRQSLRFERLWQIKATAAERNGKAVEPVLCRVVGAYRHIVDELPVWGAASVAIKLAGEGALDSLEVQLREPTGEVIDRPEILRPEQAAHQISLQLEGLMGKSKISIDEMAQPQWMRFGYLSLPMRKAQRLLAPVYVSAIEIKGQQESQAYIFATSATEKVYLPLYLNGAEAHLAPMRSTE